MATVEVVLPGIPMRTGRGSLGYASCTLVTTDAGARVLVDCAGYGDRTQLFDALAARRLQPEDIDVLVLTHLHFDHCVNARFFSRARVLVSRAEYEFAGWATAQTPHADPYVVDNADELLSRLMVELLDAEGDVAPDVAILFTPGHTPGAMSVVARTPDGRVAMASDSAKSVSELITRQVYPSARGDAAQASASITRLLGAADSIIPGHDRRVRIVDGRPMLDDVRDRPTLPFHIY